MKATAAYYSVDLALTNSELYLDKEHLKSPNKFEVALFSTITIFLEMEKRNGDTQKQFHKEYLDELEVYANEHGLKNLIKGSYIDFVFDRLELYSNEMKSIISDPYMLPLRTAYLFYVNPLCTIDSITIEDMAEKVDIFKLTELKAYILTFTSKHLGNLVDGIQNAISLLELQKENGETQNMKEDEDRKLKEMYLDMDCEVLFFEKPPRNIKTLEAVLKSKVNSAIHKKDSSLEVIHYRICKHGENEGNFSGISILKREINFYNYDITLYYERVDYEFFFDRGLLKQRICCCSTNWRLVQQMRLTNKYLYELMLLSDSNIKQLQTLLENIKTNNDWLQIEHIPEDYTLPRDGYNRIPFVIFKSKISECIIHFSENKNNEGEYEDYIMTVIAKFK